MPLRDFSSFFLCATRNRRMNRLSLLAAELLDHQTESSLSKICLARESGMCQHTHIVVLHIVFWFAFWVVVSNSSRHSQGLTRWLWIRRDCEITSRRPRRWCPNFEEQVSLNVLENSGPDSFLQQRVSSNVRPILHLLVTLENYTLRHFDLNPSDWFRSTSCCEIRTFLTGCFQYPWTIGCMRPRRCKRACRIIRDKVQRRLRLCHNSLLLLLAAFFSTSLQGSLMSWECW